MSKRILQVGERKLRPLFGPESPLLLPIALAITAPTLDPLADYLPLERGAPGVRKVKKANRKTKTQRRNIRDARKRNRR